MSLTKEQISEIKDQQSQKNETKRVVAPELEKIVKFCKSYKCVLN